MVSAFVPALVIGGGISGLTCAYALRQAGIAAEVAEASARAGGVIRSVGRDGFLCELGPQSFTWTEHLWRLSRELGIEDRRLEADPALPRYIVMNGRLHAVPMSPPALLSSSLLSFQTKRMILQDAVGHSKPPAEEESIAGFVRRKFTDELLDRLVGPFVSGIYAGDPEQLSWQSTFPQAYQAEVTSGSVIRGMKHASRGKSGFLRKLVSYAEGNETLVKALAERLGAALRCSAEVVRLERTTGRNGAGGYRVTARGWQSGAPGESTIETEQLVIATPAYAAGRLLAGLDAELAAALCGIAYAPVAVVSLGYRRRELRSADRGFGFLIPRSEKRRTLGTVWNSSLFSRRAPEGSALYTSFLGGATDASAAALSPDQMMETVHREISPLLGGRGTPAFTQAHAWAQAIPQYNLGHGRRIEKITERLKTTPGISMVGNYFTGPSIGACVEQAQLAAKEILERRKG